MADRFVAGVDSGGAKTIALVADMCGRIVGASRLGDLDGRRPTLAQRMADVAALVRQAIAQAGRDEEQAEAAVFGLTGADWPDDHEPRAALLRAAGIARSVQVKNDMYVGLRAGTDRPYGVVIGAGSGVNAAAIAPDGREWAFGYYATAGGGNETAQEALHAALRADDGRAPRTPLTDLVLSKLSFASVEAMLRAYTAGQLSRRVLRSLCPLVFEAACAGDRAAVDILARQGSVLAEYAAALIHRFQMERLEFDVVLSGSMFKGRGPLLIDTVAQAVHRVAPRARLLRPRFEPAVGGLLLAYDSLGVAVTPAMYDNLAHTSPAASFFDTAG